MKRRRARSLIRASALLFLIAGIARATGWREPPRFDGAGYATLGRALAEGRGYREVSRPDAPGHAHFPPAYPATLALLWLAVGGEGRDAFTVAAHGLSLALAGLGFAAVAAWWRRVEPPGVALPLTLALALNWQWHRNGGAIRSEPLALALAGAALLLARRAGNSRNGTAPGGLAASGGPGPVLRPRVSGRARRIGPVLIEGHGVGAPGPGRDDRPDDRRVRSSSGSIAPTVGLVAVLGAAILTRQILICLAAAVVLDLAIRRGWRRGLVVGLGVGLIVAPWVIWQRSAPSGGQLGLFDGSDLPSLVAGQALFYARRLPDAVSGPFVEVATVFSRARWLGTVATLGAVAVAGVALLGWIRLARSPRRRLGGMIPLATLPLLLAWPFTEAGRFLVPLVPFVLMGLAEGGGAILTRLGARRARAVAAWLLVFGVAPYAVYALVADRPGAERRGQGGFDAACRALAEEGRAPGPIMARHPADAAWLSGRLAVPIPGGGPDRVAAEVERWGVAYLVVDDDRYARSPDNPLRGFVADPARARRIEVAGAAGTAVFEVVRPTPGR